MKISIRKGLGFGLTSGIITTLGIIVGLNSGTHSKKIVLGGILLIAIADAMSDALGMHISEEAGSKQTTEKQIWESTISTIFFKFIFALSFVVPFLLFSLTNAVIVSIAWGAFLLTVFSFKIAKHRREKPLRVILEHITIAAFVVFATYFVGNWIETWII
jgi:VIT1/CCC1 family predicted Fe2+/Mn2+ transporter